MSDLLPKDKSEAGALGARVARIKEVLDGLGILEEVLAVFRTNGVVLKEVAHPTRQHPHVTRARSWLAHVLKVHLQWSDNRLGELFAQDHTTILSAVRRDVARPLAPIPIPGTFGNSLRGSIAKALQDHADRLHKQRHPAAAEIERVAGCIRRGEGIE